MRPDMLPDAEDDFRRGKTNKNAHHASSFVDFSISVLSSRVDVLLSSGLGEIGKLSHLEDNTFETMGVLTTLSLLFKGGDRRLLLPMVEVDEDDTDTRKPPALLELLCTLSDPPYVASETVAHTRRAPSNTPVGGYHLMK